MDFPGNGEQVFYPSHFRVVEEISADEAAEVAGINARYWTNKLAVGIGHDAAIYKHDGSFLLIRQDA